MFAVLAWGRAFLTLYWTILAHFPSFEYFFLLQVSCSHSFSSPQACCLQDALVAALFYSLSVTLFLYKIWWKQIFDWQVNRWAPLIIAMSTCTRVILLSFILHFSFFFHLAALRFLSGPLHLSLWLRRWLCWWWCRCSCCRCCCYYYYCSGCCWWSPPRFSDLEVMTNDDNYRLC